MAVPNRVAITAALLGLLVVVWFFFPRSETGRIRRRLHDLAHRVSTVNQQRDAARLVHIAGLKGFFAEDVTVEVKPDIRTVSGRNTLLQMAHGVLQQEPGLTVAFRDITVTHEPGTRHARVNATAIVTGVRSPQGRLFDAKELEMDWTKADGEWVIRAVRPVEAMKLEY